MKKELWSKWSEVHNDNDQMKRLASAQKSACTPTFVDTIECTGTFTGSSGHHTTTLEKCSCVDFNRRKLPCKHMYRLAMELGCIESEFSSNLNDVAVPKSQKLKLEEIVKSIENLSHNAQLTLLDIARRTSEKKPLIAVKNDEFLTELLENNFLMLESNNEILLSHYHRNEMNKRIQTLNIPFKKNMSAADLVSWCLENIPSHINELFNDARVVRLNPKMSRNKIHQYLHRKYDTETYFSLDGSLTEVPLLQTELPDDDVTNLLRKYGYYKK